MGRDMLSSWGSGMHQAKCEIQETVTQTIRFGFLARRLRLAVPKRTQHLSDVIKDTGSSCPPPQSFILGMSHFSPMQWPQPQAHSSSGSRRHPEQQRGEGAFTEKQSLHSEQTFPQTPPLEISSFSSLASTRS